MIHSLLLLLLSLFRRIMAFVWSVFDVDIYLLWLIDAFVPFAVALDSMLCVATTRFVASASSLLLYLFGW